MNYTNLFPKILHNIPKIPQGSFCYNHDNKSNYNKSKNAYSIKTSNFKCFLPSGKRLVLWFTKHDSQYYSILLEVKNNLVSKCHFKYISFDKTLTSGLGTMLWVSQLGVELCLNKIIYLNGKICNLKTIGDHMEQLNDLIENKIHNIYHSSLLQLKLPVMSDTRNILDFTCNLNYSVYSIISLSNNYQYHLHNFMAVLSICAIDHLNDIYKLFCLDDNRKLMHYSNALIHNNNVSKLVKSVLNIHYVNYKKIEYSDNESMHENAESSSLCSKYTNIYCIFDKTRKKWKPYKKCDSALPVTTITKLKILEVKSLKV